MRRISCWLLMAVLVLTRCWSVAQQAAPAPFTNPESVPVPPMDDQTARDRSYGMDLFQEGKYTEAAPWLAAVVKVVPNDVVARVRLGSCLISIADNTKDPAERKAVRLRARQELIMAQEMGDHTDLLEVLLAGLPEDGREVSFSSNAEVDRLMKAGEAAYGQGKYDEAKQAYVQAIVLDPNNYDALVFVGDTYFVKNDALAAGEWFARAIEVNPDRETAYRYWGDALMKQRRFAAARDKYIGSVIASPYGKAPWLGVNNFVRFTKQNLTWYRFQSSTSFQKTETGGTITVDPNALGKKDGSSAWMGYGLTRALWHNGEFAKAYSNEKQYRHSLKEEYAALSSVARAAEELSQGKKGKKLNDELAALVNLYNAGLLEPYILLNGVDEGISKDYVAYRAAHREVLVRYLSEVVLPPAPADGTTP